MKNRKRKIAHCRSGAKITRFFKSFIFGKLNVKTLQFSESEYNFAPEKIKSHKMKRILTIAAVGVLLAGCARTSDITKISGTVDADAIDEVNVAVPEMSIDTLVPVTNGKFYVEIPANPLVFASVAAANYGVQFIPDGTELDIVIGTESKAVSRNPKSVQSRFAAYQEKVMAIMNDFNTQARAIMSDTGLTEEERNARLDSNYTAVTESFVDFNERTVKENSDNIISLLAVQQASMLAGDMKIDNRKFKDIFHEKARMISPAEVEEKTGHPVGGVCPFAAKEGVRVFLDISLRRFTTVFPAAGSPNSAIELTPDELESLSGSVAWIDVSKEI